MQVYGNKEPLMAEIKRRYNKGIEEIEKDTLKEINEIKSEAVAKITNLREKAELVNDSETKKLHSKIISEEKLEAKKEFEEKREKIIEKVFHHTKHEAEKIAHSDDYIKFVEKSVPKKIIEEGEIFGDSDYYKKRFPELKIKKGITGIQIKTENVLYDLSVDSAIEAKKEQLRDSISKILFENV